MKWDLTIRIHYTETFWCKVSFARWIVFHNFQKFGKPLSKIFKVLRKFLWWSINSEIYSSLQFREGNRLPNCHIYMTVLLTSRTNFAVLLFPKHLTVTFFNRLLGKFTNFPDLKCIEGFLLSNFTTETTRNVHLSIVFLKKKYNKTNHNLQ